MPGGSERNAVGEALLWFLPPAGLVRLLGASSTLVVLLVSCLFLLPFVALVLGAFARDLTLLVRVALLVGGASLASLYFTIYLACKRVERRGK
jgi:hypothetical protein